MSHVNNLSTWKLEPYDIVSFVAVNLGTVFAIWIILRYIWKPAKPQTSAGEDKILLEEEKRDSNNGIIEIHEGEVAGDYSEDWMKTFDFLFLISMSITLVFNVVITTLIYPAIWRNWQFWIKTIVFILILNLTLLIGGLLCRYFCAVDAHGYIITNRHSAFKVNYTKKFGHVTINLVPLLILDIKLGEDENIPPSLSLLWHYWFAMLNMLILIKPLRERFTLLMLQFNAIDRPEDRPNTMLWTVAYNSVPGFMITIFFCWLYPKTGVDADLMTIIVLINTIGDGLAEPVGIYFGKHRYKTRGCCNKTVYERSYEGSSCVFMASVVFTTVFWHAFRTRLQFWLTMLTLPLIMALSEAWSPHTVDTSFLYGIGGITLLITSHIPQVLP